MARWVQQKLPVAFATVLGQRTGSGHAHDGHADDDGDDRRDDGSREGLAQPKVLHQANERDYEQLCYLRDGDGTGQTPSDDHSIHFSYLRLLCSAEHKLR